ncbi:carboxymuconolactone decarboxylase family protein [Marinobacterium jannaschii]|uniref:carboxymuconolactone decarboxylase family protein n=1 Tax=Marinobacterium jannaschii TaxID=64970 RepID=UPI00048A3DDA|nr:carboxymuconolactone decarboxylase family protein [Marinobacterium jannaschii]
MNRINLVTDHNATQEQQGLFDAIQGQLGMVPNFLRVFANSPAALRGFLGLHSIAAEGGLDLQTKERIALTLAEQNACQYCVSAHTAIGRKAGLDAAEIAANRAGGSRDVKADAAVKFARSLAQNSGGVTNTELLAIRNAGYSDGEIVEIITHVGMNILTNMIGRASQVAIDFPKVELQSA